MVHGLFKTRNSKAWCQKTIFKVGDTFIPMLILKSKVQKLRNWLNLIKVRELDSDRHTFKFRTDSRIYDLSHFSVASNLWDKKELDKIQVMFSAIIKN